MSAKKRPKGRENIKQEVLSNDPTKDYQQTRTNYWGETLVQGLPPWRLWTGRLMLDSDPLVQFGINVRNAALMPAEVEIKCKNELYTKWLYEQWNVLWSYYKDKITAAKEFGFMALQVNWKMKNGLMVIKNVKDFAPEDSRCLQIDKRTCGWSVKGQRAYFPQALWLTFGSKYGNAYGKGLLRRMYPAWYEKWMDHGSQRLRQLRMIKDAYIGDIFWYPMNLLFELPDGTKISGKDLMRELGENRLSGGVLTLPMIYDDNGKPLTQYTPPQDTGGGSQIFEWVESNDVAILRGCDVPMEVIEASETGSGYSGRSIPFLTMLSVCNSELSELVKCVDECCLRPAAWLNWGGDIDYEIKPMNLVQTFSDDTQGSPMGGAAVGGNEPPPPPQQVIVNDNNKPGPGKPPASQFSEQFAEEHDYSCLMLMVDDQDLKDEILDLSHQIADSDLRGTDYGNDSKKGIEFEPHVTVKYGLHTDDADVVRRVVQGYSPVAVQLGKCSYFEGEDKDVVKIDIESQMLHRFNKHVCDNLEYTDTFPEYKPHMTLAYVKKGLGKFYANRLNALQGKVIAFDKVTFSNKGNEYTVIPLTGDSQFAEKQPHEMRLHEWMKRRPIPEQRKLPDSGHFPAIRTDDGAIHVDHHPEGSSHVMFAKRRGIPAERIVGGGWHKDGEYHESERSDSFKHGEQARAKERVEHKRHVLRALGEKKKVHKDVISDHPSILSQHEEGGIPSNGGTFQWNEELNQGHVNEFIKDMHARHPGLKSLYVYHKPQDKRLHLDDIQVHKEHRKKGIGSDVVHSLTKLADQHDHRVSLTVGSKDDRTGTTSSTRLKKFYGRFGFKKNKDPSVTASMMREPNSQHAEEPSEADKRLKNFVNQGLMPKVQSQLDKIEALKHSAIESLPELTLEMERMIAELKPAMITSLAQVGYASVLEGTAEIIEAFSSHLALTGTAPAVKAGVENWVLVNPSFEPERSTTATPPGSPPEGPRLASSGSEPEVRFPILERSVATLRASPAVSGTDYRDTADKVRQGAFAVTTDLGDAVVSDIRDELAQALEDGLSQTRFIDNVVEKLGEGKLSESHLENVFRTNAMTGYNKGKQEALQNPMVADAFPYVGYTATHDARVRPEHLALETHGLQGTNVYRADDPTFLEFRPPWSYNCRCSFYPVTVEQAAKKGVNEAFSWKERAERQAEVSGGSFYIHLKSTAPTESEHVPHPDFSPSSEFKRYL